MIAAPYTVSQSPFHQASRFLESPIKCVIKASGPGSAPISSVFNREQHSDIDVTAGFYVLFGSGLMMSFILSVYILQSSKEKLTRYCELVKLFV
ncbi:hypothetical protein LINGRAHAP2_LOCUS9151 [Linum grandiflorum]